MQALFHSFCLRCTRGSAGVHCVMWVISISTWFHLWGDSSCSHQSAQNSLSTRLNSQQDYFDLVLFAPRCIILQRQVKLRFGRQKTYIWLGNSSELLAHLCCVFGMMTRPPGGWEHFLIVVLPKQSFSVYHFSWLVQFSLSFYPEDLCDYKNYTCYFEVETFVILWLYWLEDSIQKKKLQLLIVYKSKKTTKLWTFITHFALLTAGGSPLLLMGNVETR